MNSGLAKTDNTVYQARQSKKHREATMYAVIAIGVTVALFALLNLIDYRRID